MSSCVTAPCSQIEGDMKAGGKKGKKNDPMVADFLTSGAEAVAHKAESCQFGFVNRQLCGSSEEYCGAYRQHRFLFFFFNFSSSEV